MTSPEYSSHFSLANIPFGVASSKEHPSPQCVTRLENTVIFLGVLQGTGVFKKVTDLPNDVFDQPTLNEFAALPKSIQREVRTILQSVLTERLPENSTEDIAAVTLHMPVSVGGFTDFSCSLHHVRNAGRAILNDETPPPGFFNFPIGYNGRASTVVVSGTPIVRPKGHTIDRTAATENKPISFGPSKAMDYELEIGVIVGKPVPRVQGVNAKDADEHIFGMVILNDWSGKQSNCGLTPML
jgi:fumarylacetoacetase